MDSVAIFAIFYLLTTILCVLNLNKTILMGIAIILVAILVLNKKQILKLIIVSVCLAFLVFNVQNLGNNFSDIYSKTLEFSAVITETPQIYEDYTKVYATVQTSDKKFKSILYISGSENVSVGDEITSKAYFYKPDVKDGFDREQYYKSDKIFVLGSVDENIIVEKGHNLLYYPKMLQEKIKNNIDRFATEEYAPFIKALILGDKSELDMEFKVQMSKAGVSHILAVSGMHIGFLLLLCSKIFTKDKLPYASAVIIIMFLLVVGFSPSILRASIMQLIAIYGYISNQEYDAGKAMWFALVLILVLNPFSVLKWSFWLSFASCLGIIYFYSYIFEHFKVKNQKINSFIIAPIAVTFSAIIITNIFVTLFFENISSVSLLSNILIVPIVTIVFPVSLIIIAVSFISIKWQQFYLYR